MTLDEKNIKQIRTIVSEVIEEKRRHRNEETAKYVKEAASKVETKTYLCGFSGHVFALPGTNGRVILEHAVYARVPMRNDDLHFYGGEAEIIAYSDGRRLKKPMRAILQSGITTLLEVDESVLRDAE